MTWAPAGAERYRLQEGPVLSPAVSESSLQSVATPSAAAARVGSLVSLDNPLVVVGALVAVTFGLAAFSTSGAVRVGKAKMGGSLNVGTT